MPRRFLMIASLSAALLAPVSTMAHPHTATNSNHTQQLANGQNHGPFVNGVSCGGDPAAYGLETAHHGPDAGTPGKADGGCYQTTGRVPPGEDDRNPAID